MSIRKEYLDFKNENHLNPGQFDDRVQLQEFLRDRLDNMWRENPHFTNGGLVSNDMTGYAIGFAYYDCRPSDFCRNRCYGLPLAGLFDYNMFRLAVLSSESFKTEEPRFLGPLSNKIRNLRCLKIGHWGDAVLEQVPVLARLVEAHPNTTFWWYTRKQEIALAANERHLRNLRAYLSLDPTTPYPSFSEYPYGITYLIGNGLRHDKHQEILNDRRLVALFALKRRGFVKEPLDPDVDSHSKLCEEKKRSMSGRVTKRICLSCVGRCRFRVPQMDTE